MKKLLILTALIFLLLSGSCFAIRMSNTAGAVAMNRQNVAQLLLYTGYGRGNEKYELFSDSRLDQMLLSQNRLGFNEYVITPGAAYYGIREYVSESDINSVVTAGATAYNFCGARDEASLKAIRDDGLKRWRSASPQRTLDSLVDEEVALAARIISRSPQTKVWLSLPAIAAGELEIYMYKFNKPYCQFIDKLKNALDHVDRSYWKNNVAGIYWGNEDAVQWYTRFDTDKKDDFGNPVVNCARYVSDYVHNHYHKPMLWIPYFRTDSDNAESLRRVGYIVNATPIFDIVELQPNFYFGQTDASILAHIKTCIDKNSVCNADGTEVVKKTSRARIGVEMEIDGEYGSDSGKRARYAQYIKYFRPYRGKCPTGFYAGDCNELFADDTYNAVKSYFEVSR